MGRKITVKSNKGFKKVFLLKDEPLEDVNDSASLSFCNDLIGKLFEDAIIALGVCICKSYSRQRAYQIQGDRFLMRGPGLPGQHHEDFYG